MNINLINNIQNPINEFFFQIKLPNNKVDFYIYKNVEDYNKNIIILSVNELEFLTKSISKAVEYLKKLDPLLQNQNPNLNMEIWNVCIYSNMFFELPFTMQDIIFIPYKYLSRSEKLFTNNFITTLVHERLHILQRYNQTAWDEYIKKHTNWLLIMNAELYNNITYYKTIQVANPDTTYPGKIYMLKLNLNTLYWGELVKRNSSTKVIDQWFEAIPSIERNTFNLYANNNQISKYEHPYEELAYEISKSLVN